MAHRAVQISNNNEERSGPASYQAEGVNKVGWEVVGSNDISFIAVVALRSFVVRRTQHFQVQLEMLPRDSARCRAYLRCCWEDVSTRPH